jgi:hypothetical protein
VFCGDLRQRCIVAQEPIHSLAGYLVCVTNGSCLDTVRVLTGGYLDKSEGYLDTVQMLTGGYLDTVE